MAMTYTTLIGAQSADGSIRRLMNNATIDVASVLEDAQNEIYSRLRVREMRVTGTLTGTQGLRYIALPSDFLDPIGLHDRFAISLTLEDESGLRARWADDNDGVAIESEPNFYGIWDERVYFDCALDDARTYSLIYFKKPAALSGANETNFLTNRYSHILRAALRKHAAIFLRSDRDKKDAEADLARALELIAIQDDLSYRGYSPPERN